MLNYEPEEFDAGQAISEPYNETVFWHGAIRMARSLSMP